VKPRHQQRPFDRQPVEMPDRNEREQEAESGAKENDIKERTSPPGEVVYSAIYREGEHELERNSHALLWSGFAAGMSMGFSFLTEALLRSHLPDSEWRPLITKIGYSVGFLIVILGRQQLFTKNTLTVILPLLKKKEARILGNVARLWCLVLLTNLAGAIVFALFISKTGLFDTSMHNVLSAIAHEDINTNFGATILHAIIAGWLIALMIWLLPFAESARVWVIVILAYVVGLGQFSHIIAGTVPVTYLALNGAVTIGQWFSEFFGPVLLGNVIGGIVPVALMAHAEFIYGGEGSPA
jgi:formate/nitrite transporter FocA (FNT family)